MTCDPETDKKDVLSDDKHNCQSVVGSFSHPAIITRPNISTAAPILGTFVGNPRTVQIRPARVILRPLCSISKHVLCLLPESYDQEPGMQKPVRAANVIRQESLEQA